MTSTGGRRNLRQGSDAPYSNSHLYGRMDDLRLKLQVLGYEELFFTHRDLRPLTRTYFVNKTKSTEQFHYFASLCEWLLRQRCGVSSINWKEFDDPFTITVEITGACEKLGYKGDTSSTHIKDGSGSAIIEVLEFLVQYALDQMKFSAGKPERSTASDGVGGVGKRDEDELISETLESKVDDQEEQLGYFQRSTHNINVTVASNAALSIAQSEDGEDLSKPLVKPILETKLDSRQWEMSCERVGPRLRLYKPGSGAASSSDWETHVTQSVKYVAKLEQTRAVTEQSLEKIHKTLNNVLSRLGTQEQHINKEFEHLGVEYREKQMRLEQLQEQSQELSEKVGKLSSELQSKTGEIKRMKTELTGRNKAMTDSRPLRQITASLRSLKQEVDQIDLRTGVMLRTLIQLQIKCSNVDMAVQKP